VLGTKALVAPHRSIELPDDVDVAKVAAAINPAMSSWVALRRRVRIEPGQSVLVLGATDNAGTMAVQVAKRLGAGTVIGAVAVADQLNRRPLGFVNPLYYSGCGPPTSRARRCTTRRATTTRPELVRPTVRRSSRWAVGTDLITRLRIPRRHTTPRDLAGCSAVASDAPAAPTAATPTMTRAAIRSLEPIINCSPLWLVDDMR
jgi:hypothetical protein